MGVEMIWWTRKRLRHEMLKVRNATMFICADLVEHAIPPTQYKDDPSYRLAMHEIANMIRGIATGEINSCNIEQLYSQRQQFEADEIARNN